MTTDTLIEKPALKAPQPDEWVANYGDYLFKIAYSKVSNQAIAEDLVQETFLAALKGYERFQATASFQTWLTGILKRKIADHYRQQAKATNRFIHKAGQEEHDPAAHSEFDAKGSWNQIPQEWQLDPNDSKVKKPEELAQNSEFWEVLTSCASNMPEHLSRAFSRRMLGEEASAEICEKEGISKKNLSVRLHRARLLIRRCLETRWFGKETEKE